MASISLPLTRYFEWLGKVVRFDLGTSYFYEDPVWDVIKSKFPISLFLASSLLFSPIQFVFPWVYIKRCGTEVGLISLARS